MITKKLILFLLIVFIFILQLLSGGFFLSIRNIHKESFRIYSLITKSSKDQWSESINIGFSVFDYDQAKLEEIRVINEYDLTAVLLHWKRFDGLKNNLQHLLKTGLFKEILIWNNNPQINLTLNQLIGQNHSNQSVRIINSPENLKDKAKYHVCTEARTRACFYVDDDFNPAHYLKCLIASFRSDPNLLHTATEPYTFYTNLVWTYFDLSIDLHSGFSWIGCGSVFLREHAQQHLRLIDKYLRNYTHLIALSDVFFSVWLNEIPTQLCVKLRQYVSRSSTSGVSFSSTQNFLRLQYSSSVLAIRTLEHSLRYDQWKNESITFSRQRNRRFPSYMKSPSLKDDFIFFTNILPHNFENVSFNISQDYERGTRRNLPRNPDERLFTANGTLNAVDEDLRTCWYHRQEVQANDFYAIDFLSIQRTVTFLITVAHSLQLQSSLDVKISLDGLHWISYRSTNGIYRKKMRKLDEDRHTFLFHSSEFNTGFQSFRYISFRALKELDDLFQVCEIEILSEERTQKIIADFEK